LDHGLGLHQVAAVPEGDGKESLRGRYKKYAGTRGAEELGQTSSVDVRLDIVKPSGGAM
jgi:hypothetical protein